MSKADMSLSRGAVTFSYQMRFREDRQGGWSGLSQAAKKLHKESFVEGHDFSRAE